MWRAMLGRVGLRLCRCARCSGATSASSRSRCSGVSAIGLVVDARDGAERLLHVVGEGLSLRLIFVGGGACGTGLRVQVLRPGCAAPRPQRAWCRHPARPGTRAGSGHRVVLLHHLPERHLHLESTLHLQRELGERQGIQPQFKPGRGAFASLHFQARDFFDHRLQAREQGAAFGTPCAPSAPGRGGSPSAQVHRHRCCRRRVDPVAGSASSQ